MDDFYFTLISLIVYMLFAFSLYYLVTRTFRNTTDKINDRIETVEILTEKLNKKPPVKIYTPGENWSIKDSRTDKEFLKINPEDTQMGKLGIAFLLQEITDYLNQKEAQREEDLEKYGVPWRRE